MEKIVLSINGRFYMKAKIYIMVLTVVAAVAIAGFAQANDPDKSPAAGSMMGGGANRMMGGGHGRAMMGYGQGALKLLKQLFEKQEEFNQDGPTKNELLRKQIREKRQELSVLLRSDNPDKNLIDQKIAELNRLEYELDKNISVIDVDR
jgi:Spy/CpxP family protein refolding chaperone